MIPPPTTATSAFGLTRGQANVRGMAPTAEEWIARFAEALGRPAPTDEEMAAVLELASVAAHSSERRAAPIACWLAALADRDQAIRDLVRSAFGHNGQKCSAASLAICEAEV